MTGFTVLVLVGGLVSVCAVNTLYYSAFPLSPARAMRRSLLAPGLVRLIHGAAFALSVLRLPYSVAPYLIKLGAACLLRERFAAVWDRRLMQTLRLLGDFANFVLVSGLIGGLPALLYGALVAAELIRLLAEKGQTVFSGLWQMIPHRGPYYVLKAEGRMRYLREVIETYASQHPEVDKRMRSFTGFEIVPDGHSLRTGRVRDIAGGLVYVHARWLNDPYLMVGLALRRAPWIFDPRFLQRPFYYRSQANPLMTEFVLRCGPLSPPFAWYQFGHEIKAARFTLFFRLMRRLGLNVEGCIRADGTYAFDPLLRWIGRRLGWLVDDAQSVLPDDQAVLALLRTEPSPLSALDVARRYVYPLPYVETVLLPALNEAKDQAPPESVE